MRFVDVDGDCCVSRICRFGGHCLVHKSRRQSRILVVATTAWNGFVMNERDWNLSNWASSQRGAIVFGCSMAS